MAKPYRRKGSKFWYIAPVIGGVQVPQSSKTTDYERALAKIKILEGNLAAGAPIQSKTDRKDFAALLELVRTDYKIHDRRSLADLTRRIDKHLIPALGHFQTKDIVGALPDYILARKSQKPAAANGSINQELAIIKRAFRLGMRIGMVSTVPHIEMLAASTPRQTSYSDKQLESLLRHSNELLSDVLTIYAYTGWRKASVLLMEWSQVDFEDEWISLRADQTKNRKETRFPMIEALKEIFERRWAGTEATQKKESRVIPWVFHRNGERVKDLRKSFEKARKDAGLPGHRIHDFRRTAVRALHDLGYDVKTIMDMCGFKTEAMVHRYIGMTSDSRLREAGKALAARRKRS